MTAHTDQERAEFEAWAQSQWRGINLAWLIDFSKYADFDTNTKWLTWQAARRAPAVPVPHGYRLVQVEPITGANYYNGLWSRRNWEAALEDQAVAPQPPEAAPVQLSEPVANLWQHRETGRTRVVMPDAITDCDARWQHVGALYTEQQVRQLLAAHGVGEA